jgi:hypothetical protein
VKEQQMPIPSFLFLAAFGRGPRVRYDLNLKELVAEHLEWVRRAGEHAAIDPPEEEEGAGAQLAGEAPEAGDGLVEDEATALDSPEARLEALTQAAIELYNLWQTDVLNTVPSQLLLGLCGVADRATWLLEGLEPERAARFAALRTPLMDHSQGCRRLTAEALQVTAGELEAVLESFLEEVSRAQQSGVRS